MNNLYSRIHKNIFGTAVVPDGYYGETKKIRISFYKGKIYGILKEGYYYTLSSYLYQDVNEASFRILGKWGDLTNIKNFSII